MLEQIVLLLLALLIGMFIGFYFGFSHGMRLMKKEQEMNLKKEAQQ